MGGTRRRGPSTTNLHSPGAGLLSIAAAWLTAAATLAAAPAPAAAQTEAAEEASRAPAAHEVFAGEELERYLRTLQNVGRAAPYPWSQRGLSPGEVRRIAPGDTLHPWAGRYALGGDEAPDGLEWGWVRPRVRAVYNSSFPYGGGDGPVWTGRGLTTEVRAGGFARYGPLTLVVAPVAFRAGNRAFDLAPVAGGEERRFRDPVNPTGIDRPQHFGTGPHARLDPGYSTLRLDAFGVAAGVSTAPQGWGPMDRYPLMLGPNAAGFPHVFVGTSRPLDLWIVELHGRWTVGRLEQSDHAPETGLDPVRVAPSFVLALRPRGLSGLELGATRFIHREWPAEGIGASELFQPFETVFKKDIPDADERFPDNGLATAFARWSFPEAGVEVFGEYFREDHTVDARTLVLEPDDLSGYALGLRKAWEDGGRRLTVLRAEGASTVSSHRERGGARPRLADRAFHIYRHSQLRQGHTHRGQLLASPGARAGQAAVVGVDRYHPRGLWSVELERVVARDRTVGVVGEDPADADVRYALGARALRFTGRFEVVAGITAVYNLNRYLQDDAFNLRLSLAATVALE